ncbi:MAG: TM0106 family RecB-like putative nuclease [Planctomycetes bacterium]|nr:TM0106 family RecB-like putative nuclease [Planctomycetota bacterium]
MTSAPAFVLAPPRLPELSLAGLALARETITGTHLHTLHGCPHEVVLDFRLPKAEKLPASDALAALLARGRAFEAEVVRELEVVEPQFAKGDFATGAAETLRLMREGHPLIYQGVLFRAPYLGIADLLRRVEVPSALGGHAYEVIDIKSSRKAKLEQQVQVAFYSLLLGEAQGLLPTHGALWLRDAPEERFALDDVVWTLLDQLDELGTLLRGERESRPHRSSRCDGCGWRARCLPELLATQDLSLLPSLSRSRAARLRAAGIADVAALAAAEPTALLRRRVLPPASTRALQAQARARRDGTCVRLEAEPPKLPKRALFWAAELDPFREGRLWLVRAAVLEDGVVRAPMVQLIEGEESEARALSELARFAEAHADAGALHFGERSATALARLLATNPELAALERLTRSQDLRVLWLAHLAHPIANASLYDLGLWLGLGELEEGGAFPALWWENARESQGSERERWRARVERFEQAELATAARLVGELRAEAAPGALSG